MWRKKEEIIKDGFLVIFVIGIVILLLYSLYDHITGIPDSRWYSRQIEHPILSLKSDTTIHGKFTLGCGSINSMEYYFMFINTEDGILRISVPTYYTYIIEGTIKPKIRFNYKYYASVDSKNKVKDPTVQYLSRHFDGMCKIYVPVGTIIQRFELK